MHNRILPSIEKEIRTCYRLNKNDIDVISIKHILSKSIANNLTIVLTNQIKDFFRTLWSQMNEEHSINHSGQNPLRRGLDYYLAVDASQAKTILLAEIDRKTKQLDDKMADPTTISFLTKLSKEIDRILKSSYGNASLKEKKSVALLELKLSILSDPIQHLTTIIDIWKKNPSFQKGKTNYAIVCTQRRTGAFSLFNSATPRSQNLIDNFLAGANFKLLFKPRQ